MSELACFAWRTFVSDFSKYSKNVPEGSAVRRNKSQWALHRPRSDQSFWCLKRPRFESLVCRKWLQNSSEQTWKSWESNENVDWCCPESPTRDSDWIGHTDDVRHSQVNRQENVQSTETWKRDKVIFSNGSFRQRTAKSVSATAVKTEFLNLEITHHQLCLERTRIICYRGLQDQDPYLLRWRQ